MTPDVISVKALPNYYLEVLFENGEGRGFDMKPYLSYPAFSPLTEQHLFMNAHVAYGTVVWNDDIDMSPDTLYLKGIPFCLVPQLRFA